MVPSAVMPTFRGSCHCGRVAFEVDATPRRLTDCNCSLCFKKGARYLQIADVEELRILSREDALSEYRFHTRTARHFFCSTCGIHTFHRPRFDPTRWSVNARCLEDFDVDAWPVVTFDGRDWERAARAEGWEG